MWRFWLAVQYITSTAGALPPLPEYCSKVTDPDSEMEFTRKRAIPALPVETDALALDLIHVSTIIRHGARTPASRYQCWRDYKPEWNCDLSELIKPSVRWHSDATDSPGIRGFRKVYDAHPALNELGGTCGKGHLLVEGYKQHQILGGLFANYYQSLVPPLIPMTTTVEEARRDIRFRASDLQRTLMSGSAFMEAFLGSTDIARSTNFELPVHTMDENNDSIFPNARMCPALQQLKEQLFASNTFSELETKYVRTKVEFSKFADVSIWPGDFYDCLMTMLCAHGYEALPDLMPEVPDILRQSLLNDTLRAVDEYAVFQFTAQDRVYSKTANTVFMVEFKSELIRLIVADITSRLEATQPALAADMLAQIVPLMDLQEFYSQILQDRVSELPFASKKLVVYSAHDTTILQFLGSLGETLFLDKWPPYASQVVFEVYRGEQGYFFRLIYNGETITNRIPECASTSGPRDLCSLSAFFSATTWATPSKIATTCGTALAF